VEAAPVPSPAPVATDAAALQQQVIEALRGSKQGAAADALEDSTWTLEAGEARVQTALSPTMLPFTINPEAEKIARGVLRAGGLKLTLLAGAAKAKADTEKKPRAVKSGSATAKAMEHPIVQQAQRLFDAEIQTVIDLTGKE
jgi:DNA polymerase-3 subunit gamma/tau